MAHTVERGEVICVRNVTIEGESDGLGAAAGTAIERSVTTVAGVEVSILLERGELIIVLQAADEVFKPGDYVRVIRRADGGVRVVQ